MSTNTWPRLKRCLDARYPRDMPGHLRPGASKEAIAAAEAAMGVRFPADLRRAYEHFDGVAVDAFRDVGHRIPNLILPYFDWIPLQQVVAAWQLHRRVEPSEDTKRSSGWPVVTPDTVVRDSLNLDRKWIPIGESMMLPFAAIDLHPGPAGKRGQLIRVVYDGGISEVLAPSLSAYMDRFLDALESGQIVDDQGDWVAAGTGKSVFSLDALSIRPPAASV